MISVKRWLNSKEGKKRLRVGIRNAYGKYYEKSRKKRSYLRSLLKMHKNAYGNQHCIIIRVPGRVNLMGRHIDHQGGMVNLIAIDKEIFFVASPRNDHQFIIQNFNSKKFPEFQFTGQFPPSILQKSWHKIIKDIKLMNSLRDASGAWSNYFKGAFYQLAHYFKEYELKGGNISVLGTIPLAAGLSSSSALTIGMMKTITELNDLHPSQKEIINLSASAEWFVGTRGGSGDHAAITLSKKNKVIQYSPSKKQIIKIAPFPKDYQILICMSNIPAEKSGKKRDLFNAKVLAYKVGVYLFQKQYPQFANKIQQVDDLRPTKLNITDLKLLKMLKKIPYTVKYKELPNIFGNEWHLLEDQFPFSSPPNLLFIRDILIYGIAECIRSYDFINFLHKGQLDSIGKLMKISHNGDRVMSYNNELKAKPYQLTYSKTYIDYLLKEKRNQKEKWNFKEIPGRYRCSIKQIDFLVDICHQNEGVLGAQIVGAGLGGSCIALARKSYIKPLTKKLKRKYQTQFNLQCEVYLLKPVEKFSLF